MSVAFPIEFKCLCFFVQCMCIRFSYDFPDSSVSATELVVYTLLLCWVAL